MTTGLKLKECFDVESKYDAFYTGGNIECHANNLFCQTASKINILDTDTGTVTSSIGENENDSDETDIIQTFTADDEKLITSHRSGLFKLWNLNGELIKLWKYIHKGPVAKLAVKTLRLASGGCDSSIRLWDLQYQACLLNLKGCQGVINVVDFHPEENFILGSGDDGAINLWDLETGELKMIFAKHLSKVTSLCFHVDNKHFVSAGRDKVLILWDINSKDSIKAFPTYETIESVVALPEKFKLPHNIKSDTSGIHVATAGDKGIIRVWNMEACKEMYVQENSLVNKNIEAGGLAITRLLFDAKLRIFFVVSQEQTIILHDLKTFKCLKQFVGFSDEILDVIYVGKDDSHIAVATNSPDIKLYENSTMNCQLLKGHTDLILALSKSPTNPNLMLSSGKDNSIRLWLLNEESVDCVGVGLRHTASVGAVSFAKNNFIVSVGQDTCVKVWELPEELGKNTNLFCTHTEVAHQKDINVVVVSPNDKLIATGSQDKTVKLWTAKLDLFGVLRGHKRGVWCVRFSPVDQVILTSSADTTIKLWSIADLNCLKTFEGHEASVLRIEFISNGMQFISASGEGLIKLFNIKTSECTGTFDQHEGKIWALSVKKDESQFITGGSDSLLIRWKDVSEEKKALRLQEQEEFIIQEQKLQNYVQSDQFLKALKLALRLDKPLHVLKIIQNVIRKGESGLADTIGELRDDQKEQLLKISTNWNTNSRYCQPAQLVLNVLLGELQSGKFKPVGLSNVLESALPYTERHFKRLTQLMQDLYFVSYTINCMQPFSRSN